MISSLKQYLGTYLGSQRAGYQSRKLLRFGALETEGYSNITSISISIWFLTNWIVKDCGSIRVWLGKATRGHVQARGTQGRTGEASHAHGHGLPPRYFHKITVRSCRHSGFLQWNANESEERISKFKNKGGKRKQGTRISTIGVDWHGTRPEVPTWIVSAEVYPR